MNRRNRQLYTGIFYLALFALWTVLVRTVDVRPAGPAGQAVGFAAVNTWFHRLTGVHMALYTATDWLGLVPVGICLAFGLLGLVQLVRRKRLLRVDKDLLLLGIYYALVVLAYLAFEQHPVNYRPILIQGCLEASYPSSTTLLVLSVMPTLAPRQVATSAENTITDSTVLASGSPGRGRVATMNSSSAVTYSRVMPGSIQSASSKVMATGAPVYSARAESRASASSPMG